MLLELLPPPTLTQPHTQQLPQPGQGGHKTGNVTEALVNVTEALVWRSDRDMQQEVLRGNLKFPHMDTCSSLMDTYSSLIVTYSSLMDTYSSLMDIYIPVVPSWIPTVPS